MPRKCFYDRWFQFDFVLVVITLLGQIIAAFSEPVAQAMQQALRPLGPPFSSDSGLAEGPGFESAPFIAPRPGIQDAGASAHVSGQQNAFSLTHRQWT